jgi:predicted nucleotidyltransferase
MNWGLDKNQFEILKKILIEPMILKGARLYVFGSRARGTNHPFSDIDILYSETHGNKISSHFLSEIKEDLENSALTIKVDLVQDTDLAKSYLPFVEKEKVEVLI